MNVNLIEILDKNLRRAEEEEDVARKLVYTRYTLDVLFDMWVYSGNPIAYLAFHSLMPIYNILVDVLRKRSFAEDVTGYVERLVKVLREIRNVLEHGEDAASRLVEVVEKHLLPLGLELLLLRNIVLLTQ